MRLIAALLSVLLLPQILLAQGGLTGVIPTDPSVNRTNWAHDINGTTISGAANSSILIDGLRNGGGTIVSTSVSASGYILIDLSAVRTLSRVQLRLWDGDNRYYRYKIEHSQTNSNFEMLVDRTAGEHQSVQHVEFAPVAARYIKVTGTFVSTGNDFRLVDEVILSGESNVTPHPEEVITIDAVANAAETSGIQRTLHAGIYEVSYEAGAASKYANDTANGGKTWAIELTAKAKLFGHQYNFGFPAGKLSNFATAALAAAYGQGKKFTVYLPYESAVSFFFPDTSPGDNRGSVQYRIKQLSGPNDSLLARVRDSLTRSTLWEERAVAEWGSWLNTTNRDCFGCHIQTQASVGLNDSKQKLPDLPLSIELEGEFVNAYQTWQNPVGWVSPFHNGSLAVTQTSLWSWAVATYKGPSAQQLTSHFVDAINWLITQQQANGGWNSDHSDGNAQKLYYDGAPSASLTSGNIAALVALMERLSTGFTPFGAVNITNGELDFQTNPGNRIDIQVAPVQGVTAVRMTVNDSFDSGGNFVLNELDLYNGATRHTISSGTASFEQSGYPITESFNGNRTNINDGWAVSPQVVTTTPAIGVWRLVASDIDRISVTQIYPNHQLKRYRLEYTTDPTPSATSVYLPLSITQVGVSQGIANYQTALSNAAGLFMSPSWNFARNVRSTAQSIIGLYSALPYLSGGAATQAVSTLQAMGVQLRAAQRADGGWSDAMNASGTSAPYYTAMALKALSLIADSTLDDALRKGADFLLETQNATGYWSQSNFSTALAPTTWVEIALPAIFDVLNQQYQRDVITDLTAEGFVGENRLYWSPITGANGYDVYRKVDGGPFERIASGYVNGVVTYLDTSVTNEVTYYYLVKWLDNEGRESAESNEASATPYGLQCGADTPPVIRSGPPVSAVPDEGYVYQVDATDADPSDVLTYSLTAAPSGMVINQSSGRITWTPTQQQVGSHFVKVRVSDRIGRFATQAYRINVSEVYFNREPAFYSTPIDTAYQGNPYQYVARASDPNVGDMLTYALMEKPSGASINPTTGRITWSPTAAQMGAPQFFRVRVTDTGGLFDEQTFNVNVLGNTPPVITSTPDILVYTGQVYYYDVDATDAEGGTLLYSLTQAPIGMFINPSSGAVIWTAGGAGASLVRVRVSDPANAVAEQPFSIDVIDNLAPIITSVPPAQAVVGAPYQYLISATDPEADPISYALLSGPSGMTISGRTVSYVPSAGQEGAQSVRVSASDAGRSTEQDFSIQVLPAGSIIFPGQGGGGSPNLPQVTLHSPDLLPPVELRTPVVITITDPLPGGGPITWEVELRRDGGGEPMILGSGSGLVTQQEVGVIDPSVLESDPYRITVHVTKGATTVSPWWGINVISRLRFGEFSIGATDFSIPLSGVSIDIRRQYRSFDLLPYEFGFGWRLGAAGRVVDSAPESPLTPYSGSTKVYVTKPDGKRVGFRFQPVGVPLFGFFTPAFVPDPGVTDTLEVDQTAIVSTPSGFFELFGGEYNPSRFILTTKERVRYTIDESEGLLEVRDANNNRLEFNAGGIQHSGGISVTFTRDTSGRITRVTNGGSGYFDYLYNSNGELERVTKPSGEHTDFTYDGGHRLLTITDNVGIVVLRNEYDSAGRLIRQYDANNNVIQISSDPANRTESITDRNGGVTQFTYDEDGNVTQMVDALLGVTTYTYDSNFNQTSVTNPLGQTTIRAFDGNSNLLSETDPLGHTASHTYNSLGQKLTTTNQLRLTEAKSYDSFGNLLSETGFGGATLQYTYSSGGNIQTSRDELGNVTGYTTANGRITSATDAQGKVTTLSYDSRGNPLGWSRTRTVSGVPQTITVGSAFDNDNRMTSSTDAEGGVVSIAYNLRGLKESVTNRRGVTKTFEYDAEGRETKVIYHDLTEERTGYDPEGRVVSRTDRNGRETTYQYDLLGRQTRVTYADGAFELTQYDAAGRVRFETDARGFVTEHRYDAAGRKVKTIDPLSHETNYEYDAAGRMTAEVDANGHRTEYEYDGEGRQIRVVYPGGAIEITNYDAAGRKREQIDANSNATRWDYDSLGRLTTVTDALSNVTSYGYDEVGNRVTQTDARSKVTRFEFDKLGRETKRISPLGYILRSAYDAEGNLVARIDQANRTTSYVYNNDNRLILVTYPNSTTVSFTHQPGGERLSVVDSRGTTSYTYDIRNRLKTLTEPTGAVVQYDYDLSGNRSKVQTANGVTLYTFDALNRIATVADSIVGLTTYGYDPVGNELSVTYPNGFVTEKVYDSRSRVTRVATKQGSTVVQSFDYLMDNVGNRLSITNEAGEISSYTYDNTYRLLSESETPAAGPGSVIGYTYDVVGNRLTKNDNGAVTSYSYDDDDRMLSAGSTTYLYDVNGNTTSVNPGSGVVQYGWDYDDRLVSVTKLGVAASYVYNPDNIRVGATVNGVATQYLVDPNMDYASVLEERSGATLNSRYVHGGDLLSQTNGSSTDFLHYDALGSTRSLSNASGVAGRYDYRAFGEIESHSGAVSKYLFTGEQYDNAAESYYLRARYYNPTSGRFLSADKFQFPVGSTAELNRYAYGINNPSGFIDPSGNSALFESGILRTIAIQVLGQSAFAAGVSYASGGDGKSVAIAGLTGAVLGVFTSGIIWQRTVPLIVGRFSWVFSSGVDDAVVAASKLQYLTTTAGKMEAFNKLGYSANNMDQLGDVLLATRKLIDIAKPSAQTGYGAKWEVATQLIGKSGESAQLVVVWQKDAGTSVYRLITAWAKL